MKCGFFTIPSHQTSVFQKKLCGLTGRECLVEELNHTWCLRRIWAEQYQAAAKTGIQAAAKSQKTGVQPMI